LPVAIRVSSIRVSIDLAPAARHFKKALLQHKRVVSAELKRSLSRQLGAAP
jgi:hypothetical protein